MSLDEARLAEFVDKFTADVGAAMHASTVVIGDKLGLYRALADLGPTDAAALAATCRCDARLAQEWLDAQYVSGYCHHSEHTACYWLSPEQAAVLADPASPVCLVASMTVAASTAKDEEKIRGAFRTGAGLGWHEHHDDLFHGTERVAKQSYAVNLVARWLPALDGVVEKLTRGGSVADVGCGHGASTILLAEAFPHSTVTGFDSHRASIDVARARAAEAGIGNRVRFEVATTAELGNRYELICTLDARHEMGDPPAAARDIRRALAPDGTWLLVEPMAGDRLADNVTPVGRIVSAASVTICTPAAQARSGCALGGNVPDAVWARVARDAGFTRFRRAAHTASHRVFEVRS
jgi:SAM-dependent methyltransferase